MEKMNMEADEELWRVLQPVLTEYALKPVVDGGPPRRRLARVQTTSGVRSLEVLLRRQALPVPPVESDGSWILAAPRISAKGGSRLRQQGIFYLDTAGNAFIDLPGYRVEVEGRTQHADDFWQRQTRVSTVFTPAGLRVLFVLLVSEKARQAPQRKLADDAGVSVGTVSETIRALAAHRVIVRDAGAVHLLDERRLRSLWIENYIARLAPRLLTRRFLGPPLDWWLKHRAEWSEWATLGGESGLQMAGTDLVSQRTVLYGTPPWKSLVIMGRLRPDDQGNVELRQQFWGDSLMRGAQTVPELLLEADGLASVDPRVQGAVSQLRNRDARR